MGARVAGMLDNLQLSFIVNYSRPHISKHIGILKDELAVRVSRKDGRDLYYVINDEYFKAAEIVMSKVFRSIYSE